MKQLVGLLMAILIIPISVNAQKLIRVVYVKDGKITKIAKEADWLIAMKSVNDGFERSDYKINGPLKRVKTFKDSTQKILHGNYYEYNNSGNLILSGSYNNNEKSGTWIQYDDSAKVISKEKFGNETRNRRYDSLKDFGPDHATAFIPASFKGGKTGIRNFIFENLNTEIATNTLKDEKVIVGFTISETGTIKNPFLIKSEYFAFDQEALRVISKMPKWAPATFNGTPVDYRVAQSITVLDL